jgi:catechol 2,3-dioxygenase-like lactoylglutathione lyase family enzyme
MRIHNVTFDCANAEKVAGFWAELLGRSPAEGSGEHYAYLPGEPNLLFLRVPEGRVAKNRVHLDLDVDDLDQARARAESLGATLVHEKDEYGVHWLTYQDPEGNEFCIAAH